MINYKGIPILNIYHMLSYAFQELQKNNYDRIAGEKFDQILDLLAEILYCGLSEQLKQGLYREYVARRESLTTLRGRLDINGTIRNIMQRRQRLDCQYDELSEDNQLNKIVKSTILLLLRCTEVETKRKMKLRAVLPLLSGVSATNLRTVQWGAIRFQRSNRSYQMLINICRFIAESVLLTTEAGDSHMLTFTERNMDKLFERFVRNYYCREHPSLCANADSIAWNLDDEESVGLELLPSMHSDTTLHYGEYTLIIDTKCYGKMTQGHFDKHTIHSGNLYQIYAYVKNCDKYHSGQVSGMLLYARTEEGVIPDLDASVDGNRIMVRTLDLSQEFANVKKQLDAIVDRWIERVNGCEVNTDVINNIK